GEWLPAAGRPWPCPGTSCFGRLRKAPEEQDPAALGLSAPAIVPTQIKMPWRPVGPALRSLTGVRLTNCIAAAGRWTARCNRMLERAFQAPPTGRSAPASAVAADRHMGSPARRGRTEAGLAQHRLYRVRRFRDDDVRLLAGQAKRWREAEYVALRHGAADHTAFGKCSGDLRSDLSGRVEELAVVAILDEFHGRQHALSAHLADMLVIGNGSGKLAAEIGAGLAGIPYKVELVNELEIGNACGRADRMGRIGPAMAYGAQLVRSLHQHLPDLVADNDAGERRIGRGQPLGDGN